MTFYYLNPLNLSFPIMKILIIEDEVSLQDLMKRSLTKEKHTVESVFSLKEARYKIGVYTYDCILLDIMLPDGNGLQLLKEIKANKRKEIVIILSAKDSIEDKVTGLELGADDYLPKPFHLLELSARIRSVARRSQNNGIHGFTLGNVFLDTDKNSLLVNNVNVPLLKKEYQILSYFMQRPDHIIDKALLAEQVWGDSADQSDDFHYVYAQIKNLKQKLAHAEATIEIKSIYGFGYKLISKEDRYEVS